MILERLATYFGYKAVIRINISHTYIPEIEKSQPAPLLKSLPNSCINMAENVEDEELRNALKSIARTLSGG